MTNTLSSRVPLDPRQWLKHGARTRRKPRTPPGLARTACRSIAFAHLLDDLATLAYNVCHTPLNPQAKIVMITRPTPIQEKAFRLLNVNPTPCTQ